MADSGPQEGYPPFSPLEILIELNGIGEELVSAS